MKMCIIKIAPGLENASHYDVQLLCEVFFDVIDNEIK
jgi:hypothetical protein